MQIKKLAIAGKSDATITMILDNLESMECFPEVIIINNLNLPVEKTFQHSGFNCRMVSSMNEITDEYVYALGVYDATTKIKVHEAFNLPLNRFINLIHHSASVSTTTKLGSGCLVNSLVSVAAHSLIGNFVSINRNASVGHHTVIEDFVTINPGAHIAGSVLIERGTQIGMGALVVDGVKIGTGTLIGAGAVVTKDMPAGVIAFGNPCKIIKQR